MANSGEFLRDHEMRGESSCVAWGYEFIAKWHDQMRPGDFAIQTCQPSGLGFSPADRNWFLSKYRIPTEEKHVALADLADLVLRENAKNVPPIVRLFSRATIAYETDVEGIVKGIGISRDYHIFAAFEENGRPLLFGRIHKQPTPIILTPAAIKKIEAASAALYGYEPIACLLHTSPSGQQTN